MSLRLEDFSDIELLMLVKDHADPDGWVTTPQIAQALNLGTKFPNTNVGVRFGWLNYYGALVKHPEKKMHWRLTTTGEALISASLSRDEEVTLTQASDEKLLRITRALTSRFITTNDVAANLVRREWRYGTHSRRFRNR